MTKNSVRRLKKEDMAGIKSQRKGRTGELELVRVLNDLGVPAEPGLPMSYGLTADIVGVPGIHVECKRVEHLNITEAMSQSIEDSRKFADGLPTVFHRRNRGDWMVTMRLSDWVKMYKEVQWTE